MGTANRGLAERFGPQRARHVLLALAILSLLIIVAVSAVLVLDGLRHERKLQALGIAALALMVIVLWLRALRTRWRSLQIQTLAPPYASEETGVWGVGGPGMRTPGATGIYTTIPGKGNDKSR